MTTPATTLAVHFGQYAHTTACGLPGDVTRESTTDIPTVTCLGCQMHLSKQGVYSGLATDTPGRDLSAASAALDATVQSIAERLRDPRNYPCSHCGSAAGTRCKGSRGGNLAVYHHARIRAAEAKNLSFDGQRAAVMPVARFVNLPTSSTEVAICNAITVHVDGTLTHSESGEALILDVAGRSFTITVTEN